MEKFIDLTRAIIAKLCQYLFDYVVPAETDKCGNVGIWALFDLCAYYGIEPNFVLIEGKYSSQV